MDKTQRIDMKPSTEKHTQIDPSRGTFALLREHSYVELLSYSISALNHIRAVSGLALMKISQFSGILKTRKALTSSSSVISIVFSRSMQFLIEYSSTTLGLFLSSSTCFVLISKYFSIIAATSPFAPSFSLVLSLLHFLRVQ